MRDSHSSSWKEPYLEALRESDKEKLTELVYAAEGAIFLRLQELVGSADHPEERSEIKVACAALLSIQINKLGFPLALLEKPTKKPVAQTGGNAPTYALRRLKRDRRSVRWDVDNPLQKAQTISTMAGSNSSTWKEPYLAALREPDKQKLIELVHATELAMYLRLQELAGSADGQEERNEIGVASENLLTLKTLLLGWPSPIPCEPQTWV